MYYLIEEHNTWIYSYYIVFENQAIGSGVLNVSGKHKYYFSIR